MHYSNGRKAEQGDWIIGPTHTSNGEVAVGIVTEIFTKERGDCTARLMVFASHELRPYDDDSERGGLPVHMGEKRTLYKLCGREQYADISKLLRCDDGLRLAMAVHGSGLHDSPFFDLKRY
jgi:hypothetical protein